jgi:multidrug efflux pump subunit AcrB
MAHGRSDDEIIKTTHNVARFFTENRQVAWIVLLGTVVWGVYGYLNMPKRKDPDITIRVAVAVCPWPGVNAEKVEQLVTRKIEQKMTENSRLGGGTDPRTFSKTRDSLASVYVVLNENVTDVGKQFDDIQGKLDQIHDLPDGAGPITFIKDFGDTATLMLTVASPKVSATEVSLRAKTIQHALEIARQGAPAASPGRRFAIIFPFPQSISPSSVRHTFEFAARVTAAAGGVRDIRIIEGSGFTGLDGVTTLSEDEVVNRVHAFTRGQLVASGFHPDAWQSIVVFDPKEIESKLAAVAGPKYSYRELDDFTNLIQKTMLTVDQVSKVERSGVVPEQIVLEYSQERLASYNLQVGRLRQILGARNITAPGGVIDAQGKNLVVNPSGELHSERELGDILLAVSPGGAPVYLRDLFSINREYQTPPQFVNFYSWRDPDGVWHRDRAITLSIQMRAGEQVGKFAAAVDKTLAQVQRALPEDLIIARTSDQPRQVKESVQLFLNSLYEAIGLVVLVALVGFWEWRTALLLAISIPLTLAMTFGMMYMLGIDIQQVSIASLIIALGLLVDDPVVAGDAIKRDLAIGHPPLMAAWLGPTKLAKAILFATITNIVAYLPFLMLSGDKKHFLFSLPIVLACSLLASRIVSMTFIPLLGYYLLRPSPKPEIPLEQRKRQGFVGTYYRTGKFLIEHRWKALAASCVLLAVGAVVFTQLRTQFFPKDEQYLSYVDVWLPGDAPLITTNDAVLQAERVIQDVAAEYGKEHLHDGKPAPVLKSLTTFEGGGGPRFWFSISPEQRQLNYAQIILEVEETHETNRLVGRWQKALETTVPGARIDVRQLETASAVGYPVQIRISGEDIDVLRDSANQVSEIFRSDPQAERIRDDWGEQSFVVQLLVDPDRANLAGITNLDVANSSTAGMSGYPVARLRENDKQIPIVARLRMEERARLSDIQNLYVYSETGRQKVPLRQVSSISYATAPQKICRRNQFRTVTVSCYPVSGVLASQVMNTARAKLTQFAQNLPPGYKLEIGGEEEQQVRGFRELAIVMVISIVCIFLALTAQFSNAVKPFIVFAAIPYGMTGALLGLFLTGTPFGFMGFLGIVSLVGVIVSHVIVLFDFIEEAHAKGESLEAALLDAGIVRLRPVMITVGATVLGLVPLAMHGGPLWQPLCYAQIGGLTLATFITLLLVPVIYSICVLDLKIVHWERAATDEGALATSVDDGIQTRLHSGGESPNS